MRNHHFSMGISGKLRRAKTDRILTSADGGEELHLALRAHLATHPLIGDLTVDGDRDARDDAILSADSVSYPRILRIEAINNFPNCRTLDFYQVLTRRESLE